MIHAAQRGYAATPVYRILRLSILPIPAQISKPRDDGADPAVSSLHCGGCRHQCQPRRTSGDTRNYRWPGRHVDEQRLATVERLALRAGRAALRTAARLPGPPRPGRAARPRDLSAWRARRNVSVQLSADQGAERLPPLHRDRREAEDGDTISWHSADECKSGGDPRGRHPP
jgi:hypothetical protein